MNSKVIRRRPTYYKAIQWYPNDWPDIKKLLDDADAGYVHNGDLLRIQGIIGTEFVKLQAGDYLLINEAGHIDGITQKEYDAFYEEIPTYPNIPIC